MGKPIEEVDFTVRTYAVLKRNGINTVDEIKEMNFAKMTALRNIGRKSVEEIEDKLGIEFK